MMNAMSSSWNKTSMLTLQRAGLFKTAGRSLLALHKPALTVAVVQLVLRRQFWASKHDNHGPVQPMFDYLFAKPQVTAVRSHNPLVPEMYNYSFKRAWLSDPSTYPLLAVGVFTGTLILGFSYNALTHYKDVKINPEHKHQTIRDWGEEHQTRVAEVVGKRPIGMNARRYKTVSKEGLGIDHDQWMKEHEKQNPEEYEYDKKYE